MLCNRDQESSSHTETLFKKEKQQYLPKYCIDKNQKKYHCESAIQYNSLLNK